ncbi:MAG: sensor histidine kinase [Thermonemataceae bacterium]
MGYGLNHLNQKTGFRFLKQVAFWIVVYLYLIITADWNFYLSVQHQVESQLFMASIQLYVAIITMQLLVPHLLNKKRYVQFGFFLLVLLASATFAYHVSKYYYLEPKYSKAYVHFFEEYGYKTVWQRMVNIPVLFSKMVTFFSPTLLLLLFSFYRNQERLSKLNEQKKISELTTLKNQLNPHFLFNTLNNLYSLAIQQSHHTPEVIEKLAHILDYMLYRCNERFVPINKEIALIENYVALEKIRYGKRVQISFEKKIYQDLTIGPLLLLTFIENAFKHGVVQELHEAYIKIHLCAHKNHIMFQIENSKPALAPDQHKVQGIGLQNIKKQLALLYPDKYDLTIYDEATSYKVHLKLKAI